MAAPIDVDYLVIGAGAMGMAFVDTMLTDSNKTFAIVDRDTKPGGHWPHAYPFVRLHQPAAYYGVNSTPLGSSAIDRDGWNKGLYTLASGNEVSSYFERIMQDKFLPSGRVQYFPEHEYLGDREFRSNKNTKLYRASHVCCIVDATYSWTEIPSARPPPYHVEDGIDVVAPNDLPNKFHSSRFANFTVVGAGKTGIDSVLWLLGNNVETERITWIMPRDPYFLDREAFQPGPKFVASKQARTEGLGKAVMGSKTMEDFVKRQFDSGHVLQFDEDAAPTTFHCSTVSKLELEALRKVSDIVRKGRIVQVTEKEVSLQKGSHKPKPNNLYVDCTANAIAKMPLVPVFQEGKITLQPVRTCQQTFSAAFIAHVETTYESRALKNQLCGPVPMPDVPADFPLAILLTNLNTVRWYQHPKTYQWIRDSRLNMYGDFLPAPPEDPERHASFAAGLAAPTEQLSAKLLELVLDSPNKHIAQKILSENQNADSRL
ncbi:hypothetical protein M409DRAFT_30978 [Zasmidium cellare ATCC 36951]|uniref:FAD/NAD(P)-binding domain-containing protein n=1 Tax=Zasmidium cellare ATCC 36951 TaxID=1080233 RepID=A0A6A6BY78_ZASCE|nr:uncharacterized protein M409DRAFT_30978 [Zasmidium cellare ATCC 36951]KAF2158512.1 hypothetical protein M409DRAFT_30978 [Zasmidium cellare ATCC 36951]